MDGRRGRPSATGEPSKNGHFIEPSAFVEKWVRQSPDNLWAMIQLIGAELSGLTATNEVPRMVAAMQLTGELMESNPLFTAYFAAEVAKAEPAEKRADVTNVQTKAPKAPKTAAMKSLDEIPEDLAAV